MVKLTRRQVWKRIFCGMIILSLLTVSVYCDWRHFQESRWLAAVSHRIVARANAHTPREQAIALRDYVRAHVSYAGAQHEGRPFLRATSRETIESGLGFCGESARVFLRLAYMQGLRAQRVNLHGRIRHVVTEVEIAPGRSILVDPQANPQLNVYFDRKDLSADELVSGLNTPFLDYSNLNLRRIPFLGDYIQRIKTRESQATRMLESPWLVEATLLQLLSAGLIVAYATDRLLVRYYARRLGTTRNLRPSSGNLEGKGAEPSPSIFHPPPTREFRSRLS